MKRKQDTDELVREIRTKRVEQAKSKKKKKRKNNVPHISRDMYRLSTMSESRDQHESSKECIKQCPKKFSLIEAPEDTLSFISSVAALNRNTDVKVLSLDHSKTTCHDLAAEVLLGVAVKTIKNTANRRNRKVRVRGRLPKSERKKRLIRSMGVIKQLDIEHEEFVEDKLEIFDFSGSKNSIVTTGDRDRKNQCTTRFVDHIDNCLEHSERQLTDDSKEQLVNYLGEIIGNAEDHSGESKWYVCGYLDHIEDVDESDDEDEYHFCEIVIYNFGKSIAETFTELNDCSFPLKQVKPYLDAHERGGWFSRDWDRDTLLTLVALQGCVSSKNLDQFMDRGQGTVDLIEFFQNVSEECLPQSRQKAKMAIISGSTHIFFDGKYRIESDETGKDVIAFNDKNDLNVKPDSRYVRKLKGVSFPGTVIAARFPISERYTETA